MDEFDGKTAVITGAAGGVGYETATMLVAGGANVHIIDLLDPPALPEGPGRAIYHQGDLTGWGFVSGVFDGLKRLDYLVNGAGVLWFGKDVGAVDIEFDIWDQVMAINLKSMVMTMKCAVPMMQERGGAIVNIASIQCLRGDPAPQDAYQASKAGVIALTAGRRLDAAAGPLGPRPRGRQTRRRVGAAGPRRHGRGHRQRDHVPAVRQGILDHRHGHDCRWRGNGVAVRGPG
jgi:3-oxoacyl-[acyl-carrier protein] reductase